MKNSGALAKNHNQNQAQTQKFSPRLLAFDADDTLWENEPLFRDVEIWFVDAIFSLTSLAREEISRRLHEIIIANLPVYGFGVKSFMLSLLETAQTIGGQKVTSTLIAEILAQGRAMLCAPLKIIDGVEETLSLLAPHYRMIVVTKGDVLDQEQKLARSSLANFFDHCEVFADKTPQHYQKLFARYGVAPQEVLMIGNSIKSDILPVLEIGGTCVYIPFHTVWHHELATLPQHPQLVELTSIRQLPQLLVW